MAAEWLCKVKTEGAAFNLAFCKQSDGGTNVDEIFCFFSLGSEV